MEQILINGTMSMVSSALNNRAVKSQMKMQMKQTLQQMETARKQAIEDLGEIRKNASHFIGQQTVSLINRGWGITENDALIEGSNNLAKLDLQKRNDYYEDHIKNLSDNFVMLAKQQTKMARTQSIMNIVGLGVGMGVQSYLDRDTATKSNSNFGEFNDNILGDTTSNFINAPLQNSFTNSSINLNTSLGGNLNTATGNNNFTNFGVLQ
jgi:hypothetical protein